MSAALDSHAFSIELRHKRYLKTVAIPINGKESVVVEGFLGRLTNVSFVEDRLLEIYGEHGVFRIDLKPEEALQLADGRKEVKQ